MSWHSHSVPYQTLFCQLKIIHVLWVFSFSQRYTFRWDKRLRQWVTGHRPFEGTYHPDLQTSTVTGRTPHINRHQSPITFLPGTRDRRSRGRNLLSKRRNPITHCLGTSQYSEGPATSHLDTGFSLFRCAYKQMLRWFPRFQVATTCFSCSPPDLNLLVTNFIFCVHVK